MASADGFTDGDVATCRETMSTFSVTSGAGKGDPNTLNSKACGKMVKDCLPKEVVTIADASVFPKYKEKGKQHMNLKDNAAVKGFVCDLAFEFAKLKLKNAKLPKDDPSVKKYEREFADKITKGKPDIKTVVNKNIKTEICEQNCIQTCLTNEIPSFFIRKCSTTYKKTSATGNVAGMTDSSKYTGAHKERFDESGKGKGAAGRTDKTENTGYVGNYKGEGSYGKK